jgi:predicted PurR-regulated permease PerM
MFPPNLRPDVEHILSNAGRIINRYIRMQLVLAVIVGLLSYIGLYLLDVPFAGPLAILLGFTELISIIGPIIGGAIAVIVTLATEPGLTALWVLLLVIGVQQVENQLLVPRFQGYAIEMNPGIVIMMLVLVGQVFGLMGLVVALPVAGVLRDTYLYIYRRLGDVAESGDNSGVAPT